MRCAGSSARASPSPSTWAWMEEGTDALKRYYGQLPDLAAGAARMALADLRPARAGVGAGESRVAVNRRETAPGGRVVTGTNPGGVIDPHLLVVRIDARDGSPLAAIIGYTMHPTTMGPTNRRVSADWPGHLKRVVEGLTGATCLFAQGATGNVGPGPEGFTDDARVIRRLGAAVGCEAARVYFSLQVPPLEFRHERVWDSGAPLGKWVGVPLPGPSPRVRVVTRELRLPVRPQPSVADAAAGAEAAR